VVGGAEVNRTNLNLLPMKNLRSVHQFTRMARSWASAVKSELPKPTDKFKWEVLALPGEANLPNLEKEQAVVRTMLPESDVCLEVRVITLNGQMIGLILTLAVWSVYSGPIK
jgi:hypothetical protein